jgi:hypothetical protein
MKICNKKFMYKIFFLILFLPFISFSQEMQLLTATEKGHRLNEISVDNSGNIFAIGDYFGSNSWGFISKFDKKGEILWEYHLQIPKYRGVYGRSIRADSEGNCIATFIFLDTLNFLGQTFGTPPGLGSILIIKLNSEGTLIWSNVIARGSSPSLVLDKESNVFLVVGIRDSLVISGTPFYSSKNKIYVLLSFDKDGNYKYIHHGNVHNLNYRNNEFVYYTGFTDTITLGNDTFYSMNGHGLTIKRNKDFEVIWAKQKKVSGNAGLSLQVDDFGDIIYTGQTRGYIIYGGDTIVHASQYHVNWRQESYVYKLDSTGKFLWALQGQSSKSLRSDAVTTDTAGNIYTCGYFVSDLTLGDTTIYSTTTSRTFYLAKFNPDGQLQWIKQGENAYGEGTAMASEDKGNIYFGGTYGGNLSLEGHTISGSGIFVGKYGYKAEDDDVFVKEATKETGFLNLFPNPTRGQLQLHYKPTGLSETALLYIYNSTGALVHSQRFSAKEEYRDVIDVSAFSSGVYFINVLNGEERVSKKFVVGR